MKPLRTGLAAGLLAGGVSAANKLIAERSEGGTGSPKVVTGSNGKAPAKVAPITDALGAVRAKRAARRAEANRPAWVVAPAPGATPTAAVAPPRPTPAPARKLPSLEQLRPPSAKSMGASVGKYAAKQAGKAITKAAADRVGKAIEVIEVLEKVVASAAAESASKPDMTPSGPGAIGRTRPPTANVVSVPVRPGPAEVPSTTSAPKPADATEASAPAPAPTPAEPPKPRGTLVSVRKFERGPRVVVGPSVKLPPPEPVAPTPAAEAASVDQTEPVADAVVTPVHVAETAAVTELVAPPEVTAPAAAAKPARKAKAAPKKAPAKRAPAASKPTRPSADDAAPPPAASPDETP